MKKRQIIWILMLVLLVTACAFWDSIIDFLPIDQSGWADMEGNRCYLDEDGDPVLGWQEIDGRRYFFRPENGAMHTGWLEVDGSRYYLGEDGTPQSGWLEQDGARCYLNAEGTPASGWVELEEGRHYFEDGIPHIGWLEVNGQRFYLDDKGMPASGWLGTDEGRYYLDENGSPYTGWVETPEGTYYMNEEGISCTGWVKTAEETYYFGEDGMIYSGWLEAEDALYYIQDDGTPVTGRQVIDGETYYFTSTGANIILVNYWNALPEDYEVELVQLDSGHKVAAECYDALMQMLSDCKAAGYNPKICSAYRTMADQRYLFNRMIEQEGSYAAAAKIVAVPGTSEHHLGLAVDIADSAYTQLNYTQADRPTQKWLMENCWKYGFIVRYPDGDTEITGIIYEPWHYRYVGTELSMELYELGVCLEVYLDNLTNDGTTCGGKLVVLE